MEMTETLKSAIEDRNVSRLHSVFYTIAHENPSFASGKYEETLRYVKSLNIDGFIETHDGSEFASQDNWDKEYWATIASKLQDNFSQERIDHLIDVGHYVYGEERAKGNGQVKRTGIAEGAEMGESPVAKKNENTGVRINTAFEKPTSHNHSYSIAKKTTKISSFGEESTDTLVKVALAFLGIGLLVKIFKGKK